MDDFGQELFKPGMTPDQLAKAVMSQIYGDETPSIPIDSFKLMREYGIVYQFMNFDGLEGVYLVPESAEDPAVVGINYNRPITRQRYTAAHELCHHIKDRQAEICPIGDESEAERYAENFAAELLMPEELFLQAASEYMKDGLVSMDDALLISERFGVSFQSCVNRLAYHFHLLKGDYENLQDNIKQYGPDKQKKKLGIDIENIDLLCQAVDSYEFFFSMDESIVWNKFKADFIYNENRMEGLDLDPDEVSEIITDLRLNKQSSEYCNENNEEIIQVLGHSAIYDYIFQTDDKLTIYKLLDLNSMLFKYAPFPEEAGKTRGDNNLVLGTKFETVDCHDVSTELIKLQEPVEKLINRKDDVSISEYLLDVMKIHHRITQIHPFPEGNGRSSRAMLNWMFRCKGLPPIYIKTEDKEVYYQALSLADKECDYKELLRVGIRELFRTIMRIVDAESFTFA